MAEKTDQQLLDMFAKQSDWTPVMRPVVPIICLLTVYSLTFGTDPGEIKKETRPKDDVATNKDKPRFPDLDHSWTNSVGMEFLQVQGVKVLFSKYETTNKDFRHFRPNHDSGKFKGDSLNDDRQPVVNVSWNDARDFCKWLTETEKTKGLITATQFYALPTDWEWSVAVGLKEPPTDTPQERMHGKFQGYPWGKQWPPPPKAGNFSGEERKPAKGIEGYRDDHVVSAPVGSYNVGANGLYDMSGNAWEYCEDFYDEKRGLRVLRGGSWIHGSDSRLLLSACRGDRKGDNPGLVYGFRCVLVVAAR